jgi:hypothetical protein
MKTAAKKQKATKATNAAAPAQEAVTAVSQPKEATRPARKAKATRPAKKAAEVLSSATEGKKLSKEASTQKATPIATKAEAKGTSKKDIVLALLGRKNGATLAEIMETTGWQKHTVRGFVSLLGKAGTKVESSKSEAGARTYKAA